MLPNYSDVNRWTKEATVALMKRKIKNFRRHFRAGRPKAYDFFLNWAEPVCGQRIASSTANRTRYLRICQICHSTKTVAETH